MRLDTVGLDNDVIIRLNASDGGTSDETDQNTVSVMISGGQFEHFDIGKAIQLGN